MTDLIAALAATSERKGEFVSGVAELANAWHAAGLIEGRDQGALLSAAARAGRR